MIDIIHNGTEVGRLVKEAKNTSMRLEVKPCSGRLEQLESIVKLQLSLYVPVGLALDEINKKSLYKEYAKTFDEYMAGRLGMTARHGYHLISSAKTAIAVDDYEKFDDDALKIFENHGSLKGVILDNERKARALRGLTDKDKRTAAKDAYQKALSENRTLLAKDIEEEAEKYKKPKKGKIPDLDKAIDKIEKGQDKVDAILINIVEKCPKSEDKKKFISSYISQIEELLKYLRKNLNK